MSEPINGPTQAQMEEFQRRVGEVAEEVFGEDTSVMMKRPPEGMDIPDFYEKLSQMPEDAVTDDGKFYKIMGEDASGNLNWIVDLLAQGAFMSGGTLRIPILPEDRTMPQEVGLAEIVTATDSITGLRLLEVGLMDEDEDVSLET